MKKKYKQFLSGLLALCMVLTLLPAGALATGGESPAVCAELAGCTENTHVEGCPLYVSAAPDPEPVDEPELTEPTADDGEPMSGTCGAVGNEENVTWALTQNDEDAENTTYTLTITGTGAMADYSGWNKGPWCAAITGQPTDKNKITKLIIEDGITEIGAYAFVGHAGIPEIILPDSIVEVHENAFNSCKAVTKIKWSSNLKAIGNNGFEYLSGYTGTLVLPKRLEEIGAGAFGNGKYTGDLHIPDSVDHIGDAAFVNNSTLTGSLTLEDGLLTIGNSAFSGCKFTGDLYIPGSVSSIGASAFTGNSNITGSLILEEGLWTIGDHAFSGCKLTGAIVILNSVNSIGANALNSVSSPIIQMESSINSIGDSAFINCTSVHSLDLSAVSKNATWGTSSFKSLKNPNTIYLNNSEMVSTVTNVITENRSAFAITNGGTFAKGNLFEEGKLAIPTKEDYLFGGWYDNEELAGDKVTTPLAGKTYYAQWKEIVEKSLTVSAGQTLKEAFDAQIGAAMYAKITSLTIKTEDGAYINKADCDWVKSTLRSVKVGNEERAPGSLTRLDISKADFIDDSKKQSGENCNKATEDTYLHRIPFEAFRGVGLLRLVKPTSRSPPQP